MLMKDILAEASKKGEGGGKGGREGGRAIISAYSLLDAFHPHTPPSLPPSLPLSLPPGENAYDLIVVGYLSCSSWEAERAGSTLFGNTAANSTANSAAPSRSR